MFLLSFGFILGSILGSLSKALADRSLTNKTFFGRSYCPHCKKQLRWYDLFPILSYLSILGRCRYCKYKIPLVYLIVEVVMGILIALLFWQSFQYFPGTYDLYSIVIFSFYLLFNIFTITVLMIVVITDLQETLIPDRITYPAIIIAFFSLLFLTILKIYHLYLSFSSTNNFQTTYYDYFSQYALLTAQPFFESIIMGVLIGLFFLSLIILTKGKGMGGGDFKLGIFLGLALGFPHAILSVMLAFLSGSVIAISLILVGKKHFGQTIPFGPFLSLGGILTIFWGNEILKLLRWI